MTRKFHTHTAFSIGCGAGWVVILVAVDPRLARTPGMGSS
jgi:hypothetical protein